MNSVQELIRKKLAAALEEEKRRVARSLLEDFATSPVPTMKPVGVSPSNPKPPKQVNAASDGMKRQKKMLQMQTLRQKLGALQSQSASSKDPSAMRAKVAQVRQKLAMTGSEMSQIGR